MTSAAATPTVKSAMRTLDIIEFVVSSPEGIVAQDIAEALAIPASSLSYLLSTLVEREYLAREGRRYFPGAGLDRLAVAKRPRSLLDTARPLLRGLRNQLDETCSLMVLDDWEVEARITEPGERALRFAIDVGQRKPLHGMAAGKAILASLSESALAQYFAQGERPRFTPATLTSETDLRADFESIRARGYAIAKEEDQAGVVGLACAIDGSPPAAVAIAIPTARFDPAIERRASELLMELAAKLGA